MKSVVAALLGATLLLTPPFAAADVQRGIRNYQEIMADRKTIEQLTPTEFQEVLAVHRAVEKQQGGGGASSSRPSYEIEVSHNDELFIINGEKYEARTYCFNMEEGDRVIFIEGSALGEVC